MGVSGKHPVRDSSPRRVKASSKLTPSAALPIPRATRGDAMLRGAASGGSTRGASWSVTDQVHGGLPGAGPRRSLAPAPPATGRRREETTMTIPRFPAASNVAEVTAALAEFGCAVVERLVPESTMRGAREELRPWLDATRIGPIRSRVFTPGAPAASSAARPRAASW